MTDDGLDSRVLDERVFEIRRAWNVLEEYDLPAEACQCDGSRIPGTLPQTIDGAIGWLIQQRQLAYRVVGALFLVAAFEACLILVGVALYGRMEGWW